LSHFSCFGFLHLSHDLSAFGYLFTA
jgi:hypothetical protein